MSILHTLCVVVFSVINASVIGITQQMAFARPSGFNLEVHLNVNVGFEFKQVAMRSIIHGWKKKLSHLTILNKF